MDGHKQGLMQRPLTDKRIDMQPLLKDYIRSYKEKEPDMVFTARDLEMIDDFIHFLAQQRGLTTHEADKSDTDRALSWTCEKGHVNNLNPDKCWLCESPHP